MDRGAWRTTVHGVAESDTAEQLTLQGFSDDSEVNNPPAVQETQETQKAQVSSLGRKDPLQKGMATHYSTNAWRIPWTEYPRGLQSMGSQSQTRLSD